MTGASTMKHHDELHERIRDLETRAERAEADSRRLERILETEHDENCKWRLAEIVKLRASVKDLEARLRDEHDDIPDQAEPRGEDRGYD